MADDAFDALLEEWLSHEIEVSPVQATELGADGAHGELDAMDEASISSRLTADRDFLGRLSAYGDDGLSVAQRVDRDAVVSTLRGRLVLESWEAWRRDPSGYVDVCFDGILALAIHRSFPDEELARYTAKRLKAVGGVLEAGRRNLVGELASPLIVGRAAEQCAAAVDYFADVLPLEFDDAGLRASVGEAGEEASAACREFGAFLSELEAKAHGSYAIGEERYSALLRERELLPYDAEELRERGKAWFIKLDAEMDEIARSIDAQAPSWRPVFAAACADHPADFEQLRRRFEEETARARAFLVEHGLVSFPEGEECRVLPTPEVMRPILAVASYISPPAFRPGRVGRFNVPWPPDGASPAEVEQRLAANSLQNIPAVTVHEAYPGHHWHLTWMKDSPRRIRQLVHSSYFSEGWALYCEQLMREQGYFSDQTTILGQVNNRLWRAGRIVVDTGLHIGDLSVEEAVTYMHEQVGLTEPVARAEVGRYCSWPTQAPAYLTGAIEIERMRKEFLDAHPGELRAFHDTIARTGALPLALAERALVEGG